jgi:hypothetical protein
MKTHCGDDCGLAAAAAIVVQVVPSQYKIGCKQRQAQRLEIVIIYTGGVSLAWWSILLGGLWTSARTT